MKIVTCLTTALVLGTAALVMAQPGGGGGGQGGGRGGMRRGGAGMGLEGEWAIVCFELKIDGEQFTKLRAVYQEAWGQRKALVEEMRSAGGDWEELAPRLQKVQEELVAKYSAILSKEQVARLQSLVEERRGGPGGPGGGRGGQGGGGGGGGGR
ncbi:MAG: hypothetical protein IT369_03450 [Candidatus Latescibacteria bacterium]|nr:hypothetical protein [Candidatus Latescibacterota bacterium]